MVPLNDWPPATSLIVTPLERAALVASLNAAGLRWPQVVADSPIVASTQAWSVTLVDGDCVRRSAPSGRWS